MPDFTSALYLGLNHDSRSLAGWRQLTSGKPALLEEPPGAEQLAAGLSRLQGTEQSIVLPSTLHLFLDVFESLAIEDTAVYVESASYPIARWGAERAALRGVPMITFERHSPRDLLRHLVRGARQGKRPLVVADGICPLSGQLAPLANYLEALRHFGGVLLIDDTQALGLVGNNAGMKTPYGLGGGGSLRYWGVNGPDILIGASLAKAFGAPLAVLSGGNRLIRHFKSQSLSRLHCSPPSVAVIQSAQHALMINANKGDQLRLRLASNVRLFRRALARLGMIADGGFFPVQTLRLRDDVSPFVLHQKLLQRKVKTLLLKSREGASARLGFVISASHRADEIESSIKHLWEILVLEKRIATGNQIAKWSPF